jgi:DUF438 domain-containing protein
MNDMPSKDVIKEMIQRLHDGEDFEDIKRQFGELAEKVTPEDIARAEQELVEEGMDIQEIQRLCEVHLALFKEDLDKQEAIAPEGHPVNMLMQEHNRLLLFADELRSNAAEIKSSEGFEAIEDNLKHLDHVVEHLKDSETHYLREENVLFPYLEKHGIREPPKVMWMEHDQIRAIEKKIYALHDGKENMEFHEFAKQLDEQSCALAEMLNNHFNKENNILFPASLQVIEDSEWPAITREFDEIGYCCFTLRPEGVEVEEKVAEATIGALIDFETGTLSMERVDAIFRTLPVDTTFVDDHDTVKFFSEGGGGIFMRTKASIGRKVQQCHPEKSVHKVNEILGDFKAGREDVAEFWIDFKGRKIHIRYFAVRGGNGDYMGTLEVVQDITDIQKIEGEKRLL